MIEGRLFQLLEFLLHFVPSGAVRLGGQGSARVFVERQDVLPQVWGDLLEFIFRELIQQMCVRLSVSLYSPA